MLFLAADRYRASPISDATIKALMSRALADVLALFRIFIKIALGDRSQGIAFVRTS